MPTSECRHSPSELLVELDTPGVAPLQHAGDRDRKLDVGHFVRAIGGGKRDRADSPGRIGIVDGANSSRRPLASVPLRNPASLPWALPVFLTFRTGAA